MPSQSPRSPSGSQDARGRGGGAAAPEALNVAINDLGEDGYELLRPVPVTIRPEEGEFLASFFDANIHATGATDQEAYDNLRSLILDTFDSLASVPASELALPVGRQARVLRRFVKAKGGPA